MKPNFRHLARKALESAKEKLEADDDESVFDAAQRLRKALEALTYERASVYAEELGPKQMKTWQPKRLMQRMLEIDPHADQAATLSFGLEPSYGEPPKEMKLLGTDNVLKLQTIKKHYDALGSYLHTPTLSQLEKGKDHDVSKLRSRCEQIIEAIEIVLSSQVWGTSVTNRGSIECLACGQMIRRRLQHGVDTRKVECWECRATYDMKRIKDEKVLFEPRQSGIPCVRPKCDIKNYIWENEFSVGFEWECRECGTAQKLGYAVASVDIG